jgi:hypothetical protein
MLFSRCIVSWIHATLVVAAIVATTHDATLGTTLVKARDVTASDFTPYTNSRTHSSQSAMAHGSFRTSATRCPQLAASAARTSYATDFPLSEKPISEGGLWLHLSPYETVVQTEMVNGIHLAHGTQNGGEYGPYDDSNAYLTGFTQNQTAEGVIWKKPRIAKTPNRDVEILLRLSDNCGPPRNTAYGRSAATGYEINVNQNGDYLDIGRFKGSLLKRVKLFQPPATGDIFKATAVNGSSDDTVITVYWNGVQISQVTDTNPIMNGNPGIGFYIDRGASNDEFGFTSFLAKSLSRAVEASPSGVPSKPP